MLNHRHGSHHEQIPFYPLYLEDDSSKVENIVESLINGTDNQINIPDDAPLAFCQKIYNFLLKRYIELQETTNENLKNALWQADRNKANSIIEKDLPTLKRVNDAMISVNKSLTFERSAANIRNQVLGQ